MRRATGILWAVLAAGACDGSSSPVFQPPTTATSDGPIALPEGQTVGGPARHLTVADGPRFSGLAAVRFIGGCSGAFVVPAGLDLDDDGPAYVLTAGHCLAFAPPNSVGADVLDPRGTVRFHYFSDSPDEAVKVQTGRIAFVTMKGVDLAFVGLARSRHSLRDDGVVPFVLADAPVDDGAEIAFAGHPAVSDPRAFAVLSACHQLRRPPLLLEEGWHFYDVEANDCQRGEGGASGAPVFSLSSGRVIAVLNTGVDPRVVPPDPCGENQPCEAGPDTIHFVPRTNYAIPVDGLGACFDATGRLDRTRAGCPLDQGVQMQPAVESLTLLAAPGQTRTVQLPLDAAGLTHYRAAFGAAATTDCRSAASYGPVTAWAAAPELAAALPGDPGQYVICVQAGPGPDPAAAGWQDLRTPTLVSVRVE